MARYREYDQKQTFFSPLDPERIRAGNPLLSVIDWFIEEKVETEVFEKKLENEQQGALAVHPKLLLKVIYYSYATGIYFSREMEERLTWDPNYQVLACQQTVDHSTICKFLLRYQEDIQFIFEKLVYVLSEMGLVPLDTIAVDGTKIQANVKTREFVGTVDDYKAKRIKLEQKVQEAFDHQESETETSQLKVEKMKRSIERIDQFLQEAEKAERVVGKAERIHLTDPDARFVKGDDQIHMGYNGQIAVDSQSHVIVAADLSNQSCDAPLFKPMVEQIKEGPIGEHTASSKLVFDAGYFSSENLQISSQQKLDVYMPEGKGENHTKQKSSETITSKDCKLEIDGEIRRLTCPGGQTLETSRAVHYGKNKYFYVFRPDAKGCDTCELKQKCYLNIKSRKIFKVKKEYFNSLELRKEMSEKLSTPSGKEVYKKRSCTVEHVFGEIKETYSFRKFLHRGLEKVKLIWYIICTAYNFRKLAGFALG